MGRSLVLVFWARLPFEVLQSFQSFITLPGGSSPHSTVIFCFIIPPGAGLEPATNGLTNRRSAIELPGTIIILLQCPSTRGTFIMYYFSISQESNCPMSSLFVGNWHLAICVFAYPPALFKLNILKSNLGHGYAPRYGRYWTRTSAFAKLPGFAYRAGQSQVWTHPLLGFRAFAPRL